MQSAEYQPKAQPSQEIVAKYLNPKGKAVYYRSEERRAELKATTHKGKIQMNVHIGSPISCKVEVDSFTTKTLFGSSAKAYIAADALFNKIEQARLSKNREDSATGLIAHHVSIES